MRWHLAGHDVAIASSGIINRTIEGSEVSDGLVDWAETRSTPAWVTDDWEPVPRVHAHAATADVEAVVVNMASLLALGVRVRGEAKWYTIAASPQAPAATALARWMDLGDADNIGAFTEPQLIKHSSILNAKDVSLSVRPVGVANPSWRRDRKNITLDALKAWMPTAQILTPELGVLPQDLRFSLEQRFKGVQGRITLDIGAHVEQIVTVEGGHVRRHEAKLGPSQTDARRLDSTTSLALDEGVIDREGHFGSDETKCPYCNERVCGICASGLVS
jgi:hypothetical protein